MSVTSKPDPKAAAQKLCLACGMCCNGVLFSGVKLQPGDDPVRLKTLGLRLLACSSSGKDGSAAKIKSGSTKSAQHKFRQPCAALQGANVCGIYADRPQYCREFECTLLKDLLAGNIAPPRAFKTVQRARGLVAKVKQLLAELGDTEENRPLRQRFNRTAARLGDVGLDQASAEIYGRLTLAMHDLNFLLCDSFYPGR